MGKNDERLERLAANVMMPPMLLRDFLEGTSEAKKIGVDVEEYKIELTEFASGRRDGYEEFKRFLLLHLDIYEGQLNPSSLNEEEIDYILCRVREERDIKLQ